MNLFLENIWAKSSGISISKHSNLVSLAAVRIAKSSNKEIESLFPDLFKAIKFGSLLHDIGKCTTNFQKKIKSKTSDEENLEIKSKFRHNEIGWAFLSRNLNLPNNILEIVLDLVYWHHGISNTMCKHTDIEIEDTITDEDKNQMMIFLRTIVDESCIIEKSSRPSKTPNYYDSDLDKEYKNTQKLFARTCLISADRIISSIETNNPNEEEINSIILNQIKKEKTIDIKTHKFFGNERFITQLSIVEDIGHTTIVKAPAGFGKTLIGLLYSLKKSNKKLIWVCPRNIIAHSVYKSIIEELYSFEKNEITVELFLSNEVIEKNHNTKEEFSSDIIITNIDNYLSPSVDNKVSNRLYKILCADVVFDEYHELINETPMFSCFLNIMRTRHQITDSKTILLSATPSCMEFLWETTEDNKTIILPNNNSHYPAQHQKLYDINFIDSLDKVKEFDSNLIVLNSLKNTQEYKKKNEDCLLIHSKFENDDRKFITNEIYKYYGKIANKNTLRPDIVGTHIIQASLDLSFKNVYDSVLSPESTGQRFGRCDRWGDFSVKCSMNFLVYPNKGEDAMRDVLYTKNLSYKWIDYLRQYDKISLNLDKFYCIYNNYTNDNKKELQRYLEKLNQNSVESLSKIYPEKFYIKKSKKNKDVISIGGNKIRQSTGFDFFIIAKRNDDDNDYSNPFTIKYYNKDEFNNEVLENQTSLLKKMKYLRNKGDDRFDFNSILENNKIDLKTYGKKSNTPHIKPGYVYDRKLGLISNTQDFY